MLYELVPFRSFEQDEVYSCFTSILESFGSFDDADRAWLEKAVGSRCEHRMLGLFRCPRRGEQMDHHYPWSKGGATDRHNLVYLCARHNRRKSDHTPTLWGTWLLYRARLKYLPPALRGYAWPDGRSRENDQTIEPEEDDPWQ